MDNIQKNSSLILCSCRSREIPVNIFPDCCDSTPLYHFLPTAGKRIDIVFRPCYTSFDRNKSAFYEHLYAMHRLIRIVKVKG